MQVLSSGQCIQMHSFPQLNTISKYNEGNTSGSFDFQFLRKSALFITSNPEHPIEYLTKKSRSDHEEIMFVRRIRTDIANTVACPNYTGDDIAVGTSTGYIQMHHYKTMEETKKFPAPTINDSVITMSFNCQDDLLASLHESGLVQVFGLKTHVRTDLITFDKEISHIRFHPKRKLWLGMVSYNGAVHIYDTQAKKKVFSHVAHQSPCRDIAMSSLNDHCLVSVGYDHLINLFDTRTKITSIQLSTAHPLSACAISPCGSYCCVGNLKGQLLGFDFRQLKEPLIQTKSCHNAFIKRVEFLPSTEEAANSFTDQPDEMSKAMRLSGIGPNRARRDSMQFFFDHHLKRIPEQRKMSNLFSIENTSGTRISLGHDLKGLLREDEPIPSREHLSSTSSSSSDVEFVAFTPGQPHNEKGGKAPVGSKDVISKLKTEGKTQLVSLMSISSVIEEAMNSPLCEDPEPQSRIMQRRKNNLLDMNRANSTEERIIGQSEELPKVVRPLRNSIQTSTPLNSSNNLAATATSGLALISANKKLVIPEKDLGDGDSVEHKNGSSTTVGGAGKLQLNNDDGLELEIRLNERLERLEKQLQFQLENNTWELKNYNMIMYLKQMDAMEELQNSVNALTVGMNCLIQSDDFMQEYFRLRVENEELKARLMGNGD